ncbi:transposase domain-containing protein, partial [Lacimicrobium alkaliphilum]|uniref:transposase domain-containing protein n=1 Tax=Lacimicrobium alkaliphilum TaxID=1526571 RepID=UPI001667F8ED
ADASAMLYSLVETAKANDLSPFDYLHYLFKEVPSLKPGDDLAHLLPWNFAKS